ncbi:MAG: FMN-dependent NADH-azoreductase [Rhodospirillaceae bacterium]
MGSLLFVTSSLMGDKSQSRQVATDYVAAVVAANPGLKVVERHLTPDSIPHLGMDALAGLGAAPDARTAAQTVAVKLADTIIEEVEAADTVVLAVPMYNFSVPSTLKAWLDHVARAGRTFKYTANGPEGQLKDKRVIVVESRGGFYTGDSPAKGMDFQEPYLRAFLGFLGITDLTFVQVEGQAIGPDVAAKGLAAAKSAVTRLAA